MTEPRARAGVRQSAASGDLASVLACTAGAGFLIWKYRAYIPPFGRIPRSREPPVVFGSLLGGVAAPLERDHQAFLEECRRAYGNIFLLRLPCGKAEDIFRGVGLAGVAFRFFQAVLQGFKYQVVVLDPYSASAVFTSQIVDRIPSSRQGIGRFNVPTLMETAEGVKALGVHLRRGGSGSSYEALLRTANSSFRDVVTKTFPADAQGQGQSLQRVAGELVIPAFMDLFFGRGFATEANLANFHKYEPSPMFRAAGVDGRVPTGVVEQSLVREIGKPRFGESDMSRGLGALKEDFGVPDEEVSRAKLAILWGSTLNSQNAATWTLLHLCSDHELLRQIFASMARRFGAAAEDWRSALRSGEIAVTKADLDALPELASVFWEVARRYGKANVVRNVANDGLVVVAQPESLGHGETAFAIRRGDWISTFPQIFHRDGRFFHRPLEFRPLRFVARPAGGSGRSATLNTRGSRRKSTAAGLQGGAKKELRAKAAGRFVDRRRDSANFLMPFGLGGGACPANGMAMDLVLILVLHVLAAVDLQVLGDIPEAEEGGVHAVPPPARSVAFRYHPLWGMASESSTDAPSETDTSDDDAKHFACQQ